MPKNPKIETKKHDGHTDFLCISCKIWLHGNKEARNMERNIEKCMER